jgi:hypothetical protein
LKNRPLPCKVLTSLRRNDSNPLREDKVFEIVEQRHVTML